MVRPDPPAADRSTFREAGAGDGYEPTATAPG